MILGVKVTNAHYKKLGFHLVSERGASAFRTMLSAKQDIKVATDTILTPLVWRSKVHVPNPRPPTPEADTTT